MFSLYFGNLFALLTTLFVAALIAFAACALKNRGRIQKWGRLILIFILAGTAVSAFSAIRDAYGAPGALFSMSSLQSTLCSLAGAAIVLTGLVSLFWRNQKARKACYFAITGMFLLQVVTIESSRLMLYIQGV